jgi:hypothetical protein
MHKRQLKRKSNGGSHGSASLSYVIAFTTTAPSTAAGSNGATNTWVDELLVLHPAAVCADQLHPRPA